MNANLARRAACSSSSTPAETATCMPVRSMITGVTLEPSHDLLVGSADRQHEAELGRPGGLRFLGRLDDLVDRQQWRGLDR